jgi:pimeloyl-ACP methyl ester carboxylesterase
MTIPSQKSALINGHSITYREQGSGPVMVFLHGLAGNGRSWQQQFNAFSKNHRVIAWDAPGYGGSDIANADVKAFASLLDGLLEHLAASPVFLVGHSMGGIVAGRYASMFPERVKSLVLSCTFWGGAKPKGEPLGKGYQTRVDNLNSISAKEYGQQRAAAMLAPDSAQNIVDLAADIASETRADGLASAARMLQEADNRDILRQLELPVTVLSGEKDPVIASETTDTLAELLVHADTVVIKGAGHAPYL